MHFLRTVLLFTVAYLASSSARSILDIIRVEEDFSSFRSLLFRHDPEALFRGNVTVFVPTNIAFTKYKRVLDEKILLNHIVYWTLPLDELDSRTRIVTQENYPTLWITRGRDFVYVNNAKIDLDRSNYVISIEHGTERTVQVIMISLFVVMVLMFAFLDYLCDRRSSSTCADCTLQQTN